MKRIFIGFLLIVTATIASSFSVKSSVPPGDFYVNTGLLYSKVSMYDPANCLWNNTSPCSLILTEDGMGKVPDAFTTLQAILYVNFGWLAINGNDTGIYQY